MTHMKQGSEHLLEIIKGIIKREKVSAEKLATWSDIPPRTFRRMLRKEVKMDIGTFGEALDQLGYKIMIVKKQDIV